MQSFKQQFWLHIKKCSYNSYYGHYIVFFCFRADLTFDTLKQTFGAGNCFILSINSKSASDPILADLWAPFVKRTSDTNVSINITSQPSF